MLETIAKCIITAILSAVLTVVIAKIRQLNTETKATKQGLQSLLRLELIDSYNKYRDQGFCPIYAREAIEKAYNSYHELGGNGTITHLYEEVQKLPTEISGEK